MPYISCRVMTIKVKKFGTILNGRPAGREAALVLKQILRDVEEGEKIVLDFTGVLVLTPSYADEFMRELRESPYKIQIKNASQAVQDTLEAIEFSFQKG